VTQKRAFSDVRERPEWVGFLSLICAFAFGFVVNPIIYLAMVMFYPAIGRLGWVVMFLVSPLVLAIFCVTFSSFFITVAAKFSPAVQVSRILTFGSRYTIFVGSVLGSFVGVLFMIAVIA
jgi:hypothetical protein